jgi:hypothetical protein
MNLRNYESQLLEALLHEQAARPAFGSPVTTDRRFGHRQLTAAVLGTAAVATAAVGLTILQDGPNTSHGRPGHVMTLDAHDAVLVVNRSAEAIAASDATILHADYTAWEQPGEAGQEVRTELWYDQSDPANVHVLYYGADGSPTLDEGFLRDGTLIHAREVDHIRRVVEDTRAAEGELAGEAPPALDVDPAKLNAALTAGHLTLVGQESVAGVAVLHLRGSDPTGTRDVWADAATYLPVRAEASGTFGSYRIEYQWLPRTEATLQNLLPVIPEGYQVTG